MEREMIELIEQYRSDAENVFKLLANEDVQLAIAEAVQLTYLTLSNGNKIMLAGNGGSAADAQHIAGEFVSRFLFDRDALPAIALTTDTSIITAIGNDYGFTKIFSRQLRGIACAGDLFWAYSTSGNSSNVIEALSECRSLGLKSILLTGSNPRKMSGLADICIMVPSLETPRIQEAHALIGHTICGIVEKMVFSK